MSERRHEVLEVLHQAGAPLGVIEIADRVGIHPNTARFHLDALAAEGAIEQVPGTPEGPGRPRIGYRARPGRARGRARQYRTLAEVLLAHLAATSDQPAAAAATAGRAWGANLVAESGSRGTITDAEAVARLTGLLDALDFAPEPVSDGIRPTDRIRLRHCPFLELADPHRDLVCPLHLGLMQGALAAFDAPVTVATLEPFADSTSCLVRLAPTPNDEVGDRAPGHRPRADR